MMRKLHILALVPLLWSCNDDEVNGSSNQDLTINLSGLTDLGDAAQYEGWLIVDGSPVTTGTFKVDGEGTLSQTVFSISSEDLEAATKFVLTIEPIPDNNSAPSAVHLLAGNFSGSNADLSIMDEAAIGTGFTGVTGTYILATPTTTESEDDLSGVWFLDPSGPTASLINLPDLSNVAGWTYEGWAVIDGSPVSTGTFNTATGSDASGAFSGSVAAPPFPGEDFINNAPTGLTFPTTLQGAKIVISIEPVPDNSPMPFLLKPLAGDVPLNAVVGTSYEMNNIAASTYPSGSATK